MPLRSQFPTLPRISRRRLGAAAAAALSLLAGLAAEATERQADDRKAATLAERLKAELRVRLPEDEAYCEQVAALVDEGRLPERLVTSTLSWAVAKGRKYPFALFRKALETKAARLGLLP